MRLLALLAAALALGPGAASPQSPAAPSSQKAAGLVVIGDLGGGGVIGRGTDGAHGLFELELGAGYELGAGLRPEAAFVVGVAPDGHVGVRAGLHYALPTLPVFVRADVDWSTLLRSGSWRWLLLGGGAELSLTGVMGAFAEADLGVPLASDIGVGVLFRSGVSFHF